MSLLYPDVDQKTCDETCRTAAREVICDDSLKWMANYPEHSLPTGWCAFTSLPDISEMDHLFGSGDSIRVREYEEWFISTASLLLSKLPYNSWCIFLQSDVRVITKAGKVVKWIDKSYLCNKAAEISGGWTLMWHKLVSNSSEMKSQMK